MAAIESILTSVKQNMGITEEYEHFDANIIDAINSAFVILQQIGVGPQGGFMITDKTTVWSEYIKDRRLNLVKSFVFIHAKKIFAPETGSLQSSYDKLEEEYIWRLNVAVDEKSWDVEDESSTEYVEAAEEPHDNPEDPSDDEPTTEEPVIDPEVDPINNPEDPSSTEPGNNENEGPNQNQNDNSLDNT